MTKCYIYSSHLGGLYVSDYELDHHNLYCDECRDYDVLELETDDIDEVRDFLKENTDMYGSGGYSEEHCNDIYKRCLNILGWD